MPVRKGPWQEIKGGVMKNKENTNSTHQNGGFGTGLGFVLACVGSAVGMGKIGRAHV